MDLMGSDALQGEEAMHQMWGDSIKSVNGQHARITYDDFLLLMKGQTKEGPDLEASVSSLKPSKRLDVVPESGVAFGDSPKIGEIAKINGIKLPSGDIVAVDGTITEAKPSAKDAIHTPQRGVSPAAMSILKSAPTTPSDHKKILDEEPIDSPLSMDADFDITSSGPGVPGSAASLTPPMSPARGASDYITPSCNRTLVDFQNLGEKGLSLPGFPKASGISKPAPYSRGRSRSLDESEKLEAKNLHAVADVVRDMLLPETDHSNLSRGLDEVVKDGTKSALVVNRKLYRAHRQMRLAVLEASKRFEEQQAEHAKQVILAARDEAEGEEEKGLGMIQAGLVMRHGHTKQVSSKAIRTLLEENRVQQQALVEKANRRGGRGRRSRKKTTSDMSGMLSSIGQDDFSKIAVKAAADASTSNEEIVVGSLLTGGLLSEAVITEGKQALPTGGSDSQIPPALPDLNAAEGPTRGATVPGDFRRTSDPFGNTGKYGAIISAWPKN
jgi:hypothetical protein